MYIFLDESGDLGFDWSKTNTSKYFVITVLVCNMLVYKQLGKAVKRTLKKICFKKNKRRIVDELKGADTSFAVKKYFINQLGFDGWQVYSVTLHKKRINKYLQTKPGKKKLYNFLARFVLEKIDYPNTTQNVNLIVDKCKNSEEMKDFNEYIENQLCALLPLHTKLYISHEASHDNVGLQVVDMLCWGMARKVRGDVEWYDLFKEKILFETIYPENKKDGPFNI
jgi:hypothetical protein